MDREAHNDENPKPIKEVYVRQNGTRGVRTVHTGESKTQQQFKDDVDVNLIMKKFLKAGVTYTQLPDPKRGVYADLIGAPDYMDAMLTLNAADDAFNALPADLRLRFSNDPGKFVKWLQDEKNHKEAVELGLMVEREVPVDPNQGVINAVNSLAAEVKSSSKKKKPAIDEE